LISLRRASRPVAIGFDARNPDLQNFVEIGDAVFDQRIEPPELGGGRSRDN